MANLDVFIRRFDSPTGPVVGFDLAGYLDAQTTPQLEDRFQDTYSQGVGRWILNLSRLDYVSSAGLGLFLSWKEKLKGKDGGLVLVGPREKVLRVLQILGFDKIFTIFGDEEAALKHYGA